MRASEHAVAAIATADLVARSRRSVFPRMTLGIECWAALRLDGDVSVADGRYRPWLVDGAVPRAVAAASSFLARFDATRSVGLDDCFWAAGLTPASVPAATVATIADVLTLMERDDIPVVVQATLIWLRCTRGVSGPRRNTFAAVLTQGLLRRAGLTTAVTVPVSVGLLHAEGRRGIALGAAARGSTDRAVSLMTRVLHVAAEETRETLVRLRELDALWRAEAQVREDSAAAAVLARLLETPSLRAEDVHRLTRTTTSSYAALNRLEHLGILREVTGRRRNRVWVAHDVVDEVERMTTRIATRVA